MNPSPRMIDSAPQRSISANALGRGAVLRVLIADDHAIVRRGLMEILEEEFAGVTFGEAGDVRETMERLRTERWDVVILDMTMPNGSGLDVLHYARGLDAALPVLVLSMHPEDQYAIRALRAGACGYLTKESAPGELVKAIHTVLAGRKYVSESLADGLATRLQVGLQGDEPPHECLSDREYQVMLMIASGKSVSQIGAELSLSVKTISTYRSRVLTKTGMATNAELTRYVIERGLV